MESKKEPQDYSEENPENREEFSFLQETIKKKPLSRKTIAGHLGKIAVYGIIFGLAACIGFFALKPWAEDTFRRNPDKVTIPEDEEEGTEGEEEAAEEEPVQQEMTAENYEEMSDALYEIAREAGRSVVELRGIHGNEGWIRENYDTVNSVSGVIVADTGVDYLILANNTILKDAESIQATFDDGYTYEAKLKRQDGNLNIAIFSVTKSSMKSSTLNHVKTAVLGNSNLVKQGDLLITLGKPFGYSDGYGYGVASSVNKEISLADGNCGLILTDIPASNEGDGVLVNTDGEVVGLVQPQITSGDSVAVINALAISDLKKQIELLSNNKGVPYVGIMGVEVTEQIEKEQEIPRGIYVKNVEPDSPAMAAGIQSGDIIVSVGESKVTTLNAYRNAVFDYQSEEEVGLYGRRKGNGGYVEIEFKVVVGSKE